MALYSQMRYIFLDIDGVLSPGLSGTFIRAELLEAFLAPYPDVRIVFSSNWRKRFSAAELAANLPPGLRSRVVGVTPVFPEDIRRVRYLEIRQWLDQYAPYARWVALDDEPNLFPPFCDQLVVCKSSHGLKPEQLVKVAEKLGLS